MVFISDEDGVVRNASNSDDEIIPLSRSSVARRSLCSAGEAEVEIELASASVRTPLAFKMRSSGSLSALLCARAMEKIIAREIKRKRNRQGGVMVFSSLH